MKIGIISVVGGYSWAGSEEMWNLFAIEALRAGHLVAISAQTGITRSGELAEFRRLGGIAFPYEPLNWVGRRLAVNGLYCRFKRIKAWNPDLVCISGGAPDMLKQSDLMTYLKISKTPQVYIIQGNEEGWIGGDRQRDALKPLYSSANRIICVSRANATLLERQLASSLPNVVVIPNPIRDRLDQPLPWPDDNGKLRFATVGRYEVGSKCQDRTFEALATTEWKGRNWELNLFGSGPDEAYLKDLVRFYGLENHVALKGFERDFKKIWAGHHIHILNSRAEGLALALIESMFCGRPAIVTRTGGNHELVRDDIDGFVSSGDKPEIIRETLEHAWKNRVAWRAMGQSSFHRVTKWIPTDLGAFLLKTITGTSSVK
jgi:glycosyltransferase involved in cell wall biosynthesis